MTDRTCPPCDSRCRQGRDCPASQSDVERMADEAPFGFFVGLRNAFLLTVAAFGVAALLSWVWL